MLAVILWLQKDGQRTGVGAVQDWGFFPWLAWPVLIPWYTFKSRGRTGWRLLLGLIALIISPYITAFVVPWLAYRRAACHLVFRDTGLTGSVSNKNLKPQERFPRRPPSQACHPNPPPPLPLSPRFAVSSLPPPPRPHLPPPRVRWLLAQSSREVSHALGNPSYSRSRLRPCRLRFTDRPKRHGAGRPVVRGPVQPVCQVGVPCDAPFSASFTVQQGGRVVASFRSDSQGHFESRLPPGRVPDRPGIRCAHHVAENTGERRGSRPDRADHRSPLNSTPESDRPRRVGSRRAIALLSLRGS